MSSARQTPLRRTRLQLLAVALAAVALAGCGAEVAGSAAVAGGLAATNARQAQVVDTIKTLQDAGPARAASASD